MKIKPISGETVGQIITNLDKILPQENPSIFLHNTEKSQNTFDNKDLNNLLYDC